MLHLCYNNTEHKCLLHLIWIAAENIIDGVVKWKWNDQM